MTKVIFLNLPNRWCKWCRFLLALFWFLGMLLGMIFYSAADPVSSLMRRAVCGQVSIVALLPVFLFPFLCSALAVYIFRPWLLLAVAFWKAFSFAYVSVGILLSFGTCGWLLRWLLLFCDVLSLPLLWFYWLRYIRGDRMHSIWESGLFVSLFLLIGSIDVCLISPILAGLTILF